MIANSKRGRTGDDFAAPPWRLRRLDGLIAELLERVDRESGDQRLVLDQQNLTICVHAACLPSFRSGGDFG